MRKMHVLAFYYFLYKIYLFSPVKLHTKVFELFLKGKNIKDFEKTAESFVEKHLMDYVLDVVKQKLEEHRLAGDQIVLLSNSPKFLVDPIAKSFDIPFFEASSYRQKNGVLIGIQLVMDGEQKKKFVQKMVEESTYEKVVAYTDSFWDFPLIASADEVVAVNPCRKLRKLCKLKGYEII